MKICQLAAVDFGLYHFLLPLMTELKNRDHEVVGVCCRASLAEKVEEQGFRVEHIDFERSYHLPSHFRSYRQLVALFRRERFDIVHVHSPIAALIGRLAAARVGVPRVVYTAHGFYFHENQRAFVRWLYMALEWLGGRFTDVLFTQSQEDAETAKRHNLCKTGNVTAIGNGVDTKQFFPVSSDDPLRLSLREQLGIQPDETAVLMVGRLVAEKGYDELFRAMINVDARLIVVGSRLDSDHAKSVANGPGLLDSNPELANKVTFLGYRDDVNALMRAADIFTLPSYREGMPRSIIEAMMTGLPVVATNIRGSREEVVDEETGYLVPVKDADALSQKLSRLSGDAALRKEMGSNGHRRAMALYDEQIAIKRQLETLNL